MSIGSLINDILEIPSVGDGDILVGAPGDRFSFRPTSLGLGFFKATFALVRAPSVPVAVREEEPHAPGVFVNEEHVGTIVPAFSKTDAVAEADVGTLVTHRATGIWQVSVSVGTFTRNFTALIVPHGVFKIRGGLNAPVVGHDTVRRAVRSWKGDYTSAIQALENGDPPSNPPMAPGGKPVVWPTH